MNQLPQVRSREIIDQELNGELLIYDLQNNNAYSLNETSKVVYQACSKKLAFDDLKRQYKFTDDLIYLALEELNKRNLLENYSANHFVGMNRREVIRKIGLGSMVALPLVASIVAPTAAGAASGPSPIGAACTGPSRNNTTCVTGRCKSAPPAGTCCIDENDRNLYTCTNASTDCCLGSSACVSGRCCRPSGINCGTDNTLCCSGVCSNSTCT